MIGGFKCIHFAYSIHQQTSSWGKVTWMCLGFIFLVKFSIKVYWPLAKTYNIESIIYAYVVPYIYKYKSYYINTYLFSCFILYIFTYIYFIFIFYISYNIHAYSYSLSSKPTIYYSALHSLYICYLMDVFIIRHNFTVPITKT